MKLSKKTVVVISAFLIFTLTLSAVVVPSASAFPWRAVWIGVRIVLHSQEVKNEPPEKNPHKEPHIREIPDKESTEKSPGGGGGQPNLAL